MNRKSGAEKNHNQQIQLPLGRVREAPQSTLGQSSIIPKKSHNNTSPSLGGTPQTKSAKTQANDKIIANPSLNLKCILSFKVIWVNLKI